MFFYDYYYLVLVVPAIIISMIAQVKVQSTYNKYAKVMAARGITATEVVRQILARNGIPNVGIERVGGNLTDHFDPKANVIRLSDAVHADASVAAIGVAAHEAGHAVQYATGYMPIKVRNSVLPAANIGSKLSVPLILIGLLFSMQPLVELGILLFSFVLLFQLITLPVEFNASRRAVQTLEEGGILYGEELTGAKKVLGAAAMTYVAAALTTAMQLFRLVLLSGRRNNR